MALLPLGVYAIALTGTFINMEKALVPSVFALCILCSAEVVWEIVRWRNKKRELL